MFVLLLGFCSGKRLQHERGCHGGVLLSAGGDPRLPCGERGVVYASPDDAGPGQLPSPATQHKTATHSRWNSHGTGCWGDRQSEIPVVHHARRYREYRGANEFQEPAVLCVVEWNVEWNFGGKFHHDECRGFQRERQRPNEQWVREKITENNWTPVTIPRLKLFAKSLKKIEQSHLLIN